jgi:hypothetical protein
LAPAVGADVALSGEALLFNGITDVCARLGNGGHRGGDRRFRMVNLNQSSRIREGSQGGRLDAPTLEKGSTHPDEIQGIGERIHVAVFSSFRGPRDCAASFCPSGPSAPRPLLAEGDEGGVVPAAAALGHKRPEHLVHDRALAGRIAPCSLAAASAIPRSLRWYATLLPGAKLCDKNLSPCTSSILPAARPRR